VVGAVFLRSARDEGKGFRTVLRALIAYALASRGAVALLIVIASTGRLGSHYDLSRVTDVWFWGSLHQFEPGSGRQMLYLGVLPQLTFWVAYTVVTGLMGAALAAAVLSARRGAPAGVMSADHSATGAHRAET